MGSIMGKSVSYVLLKPGKTSGSVHLQFLWHLLDQLLKQ